MLRKFGLQHRRLQKGIRKVSEKYQKTARRSREKASIKAVQGILKFLAYK